MWEGHTCLPTNVIVLLNFYISIFLEIHSIQKFRKYRISVLEIQTYWNRHAFRQTCMYVCSRPCMCACMYISRQTCMSVFIYASPWGECWGLKGLLLFHLYVNAPFGGSGGWEVTLSPSPYECIFAGSGTYSIRGLWLYCLKHDGQTIVHKYCYSIKYSIT